MEEEKKFYFQIIFRNKMTPPKAIKYKKEETELKFGKDCSLNKKNVQKLFWENDDNGFS